MTKVAKVFFIIFIVLFCVILSVATYVIITIKRIDNVEALDLNNLNLLNTQIHIYDDKQNEIITTSQSGQKTIDYNELPQHVVDAFVSIEDKTFYTHHGLNYARIIKAGIKNLFSGYAKEGASTITQQLVKNTYLTNEKTLSRKIQEAYLAIKLENRYPKEKILETYLNVIYFGNGAYGIESAAQNYFGKSTKDLNLNEGAILAGIIQSPKKYSPILNPENCLSRRNLVLQNMLEDAKISQEEYDETISEPLPIITQNNQNSYLSTVLSEANEILNLSERDISTSGYHVYTSINHDLERQIAALKSKELENTAIIIDNKQNAIVGVFGDITARRQPASTIKPFIAYAPAIEKGILMPETPINDELTDFNGYMPKNVGNKYLGWTDVRTALVKSLNVPAVKAITYTGIDEAVDFANKFDFSLEKPDKNLAVALGATTNGVSIKKIANAYATLARLGVAQNLGIINKITDKSGNIIYQKNTTSHKVLSSETAYLLNDMLHDTVTEGTAKKLNSLSLPALCAKTGTAGASDGTNTDAWCVSYTPEFTVLTWYGNSSGNAKLNLTKAQNGANIAASQNQKIWQKLYKFYEIKEDFDCPEGITYVELDTLSLDKQVVELAGENTPDRYKKSAIYNKKFLPKTTSQRFDIITAPILNMTNKDNKITLSWEGDSAQNYDLVAETSQGSTTVCSLSGKNELLTYSLPTPEVSTTFYLQVSFKHNDMVTGKSDPVKYYVKSAELESKDNAIVKFFKKLRA